MRNTAALFGPLLLLPAAASQDAVLESAREIPVAYDVDLVVVGGSSGAVAAAVAAAQQGAKVFLIEPQAYLGEDLAGTLRLWLEKDEVPAAPLARQLFGGGNPARPLHIKRTLDEALLSAKVPFLTGCYATAVLRDGQGQLAGLVMANRAGRQAIRAKVIVDATPRAALARLAGAKFGPYPAGPQVFTRVVIGGEARTGPGLTARALPPLPRAEPKPGEKKPPPGYPAVEYTLELPMRDGSFAAFAEAEQAARDRTFQPAEVDSSDVLFQVPPDALEAEGPVAGDWPGADKVALTAFRPAGVKRLWVLSGCAAVSRPAAARLLRPLAFLDVGARLGSAAAEEAKGLAAPQEVRLPGGPVKSCTAGEVKEFLTGVRPSQSAGTTVHADERALPVLGVYDVVVVGGGTGGAPAGIGAARQKARTLVLEYLHALGGVGTVGLIGKYYHGNRVGFTAEHDAAVNALGAAVHVVGKAEEWRRENRQAGAEIWFGVLGCGAFVEQGRVKGVVVATPEGRGVVLAHSVVDSTGNADVAVAAGAACSYTGGEELAVQGAGLPPRALGASYTNTDYAFADDTDPVDTWHFFLYARQKFAGAYDVAQLVDTRERRRIVGDIVLSPMDILTERRFPDTVVIAKSNFDSHGYTVHPVFLLHAPGRDSLTAHVPYRCLLPRGLDGILVTGLAISAHRDAMPVVRMQPDVQNQGYAAGMAAACAAQSGKTTRTVDLLTVQRHLVQKGNLPASVLDAQDSFPLPTERIATAVGNLVKDYADLPVVLTQPDQATPLLRQAYAAAPGEAPKLIYAHVLGMLGDAAGAGTLAAAVRSASWDKGWNFRGMGQYGASISHVDSLIIALGRTRDPAALDPILEKAKQLDAQKEFSHHRAVALALEALGDPRGAPVLAALLGQPGLSGHAVTSEAAAKGGSGEENRNASLRELALARALYHLGDVDGRAAKILKAYEQDVRGHYARHAHALLSEGPGR